MPGRVAQRLHLHDELLKSRVQRLEALRTETERIAAAQKAEAERLLAERAEVARLAALRAEAQRRGKVVLAEEAERLAAQVPADQEIGVVPLQSW